MSPPSLDSAFVRAALGPALLASMGPAASFGRAVIDSREVVAGDLFVALPGERHDGHEYVSDAIGRGASGILVTRAPAAESSVACFVVADALAALQRLAVAWRNVLSHLEVVGVTGNVGKSTTKLITAAILGARYRVQAQAHNYNNEIGVPLCLLELHPKTERAVIEMGMYTTGEIALLCQWARPRIGIVLNVGPVHLERAGSIEAIARAKRELPEALPEDGHAILNVDDEYVRAMTEHTAARVWRIGRSAEADVRGSDVESLGALGFRFLLSYEGASRQLHVPLPGSHLMVNVLAGAAAALADGLDLDTVCQAIERLDIPTRLTVRTTASGVTLLDDTYNASPMATLAALDLLAETPGRRIALLGDMLELGHLSASEHERVGKRAAEVVDALFTVGTLAERIAAAAEAAGLQRVRHCASKAEALQQLRAELRPGDVLLAKASRAIALETVVAELVANVGNTRSIEAST